MKNIVIVVDMQKGFARYEQTQTLVDKISGLLKSEIFDVVIGTKFLNSENSIYENLFGWKRLETDDDREIHPALEKYMDYINEKYIYNCVNTSFLQRLCQLNDGVMPEKVYIVGADTDCCVLTVATSLFENNIRPIVLTEYCDSNGGPDSHNAGILCMERLIGKKQLCHKLLTSKEDLNDIE